VGDDGLGDFDRGEGAALVAGQQLMGTQFVQFGVQFGHGIQWRLLVIGGASHSKSQGRGAGRASDRRGRGLPATGDA
jgi:hypothetical protein